MNRIMELINSGRASEEIMQVLISTIPAFVVGLVLLAAYVLLAKKYEKKGDAAAREKLRSRAPWFYFVFVVVLWMSHNGILPARKVDLSFAWTASHLFYFVMDVGVFLIQGYLFGRIKEKPVTYLVFCLVAATVLELVQYLCRFGTLTALQFTAMLLGSTIGIAAGTAARKKAQQPAQQPV